MRRPRVLHIIETLVPAGAEHCMMNICKALKDRYEPFIAAFYGGALEEKIGNAGIPVTKMRPVKLHSQDDKSLLGLWRRFDFCRKAIRELRPDLVHTHMDYANVLGGMAAHRQGVPTVRHIHGVEGKSGTLLYRILYNLTQNRQTQLLAVSDGLSRVFRDATGLTPMTLYNAVDESWFRSENIPQRDMRDELGLPPDTFLVGTVGRLVNAKNYPAVLRCAQRVCGEAKDVHFLAAGDGPLLDEMVAQADSMGLGQRVHFLGLRDDVPRILRDIDVFLLMSHGEGFGLVLVEAMWMRRPIVATNVRGINEVLTDGVEGFLVPPDDDEMAAQRVAELCDHPELRTQMGEAGYATATTRFSSSALASSLAQVYDQLLTATPR